MPESESSMQPPKSDPDQIPRWPYVVLYIGLVIISALAGWGTIEGFRVLFPQLAATTLVDELSGIPGGGVAFRVLWSWFQKRKHFHLYFVNQPPQVCAQVRRLPPSFLGKLKGPEYYFEGFVYDAPRHRTLRNVTWWGFRGIDECVIAMKYWWDSPKGRMESRRKIVIPKDLGRNWETFYIDWKLLHSDRNEMSDWHVVQDCSGMNSRGVYQ